MTIKKRKVSSPLQTPDTKMPITTTHKFNIGDEEVKTFMIKNETQLNQALKDLLSTTTKDQNKNNKHVVSLDVEKDYVNSSTNNKVCEKVSLLKLCNETTCLIIQLLHMKSAPVTLAKFLQLQELAFVGVGIKHSLDALDEDYGIKCRNAVDLGPLAAKRNKDDEFIEAYGLLDLVATEMSYCPGTDIDKYKVIFNATALSNWGAATLTKQQVEAATRSALLCYLLGDRLFGGGRAYASDIYAL